MGMCMPVYERTKVAQQRSLSRVPSPKIAQKIKQRNTFYKGIFFYSTNTKLRGETHAVVRNAYVTARAWGQYKRLAEYHILYHG